MRAALVQDVRAKLYRIRHAEPIRGIIMAAADQSADSHAAR
jgi:hypothetical protein